VTGENPSDNIFVDWDVERQGNLLSNSWTAPAGIALLCLNNGFNEFLAGSFWGRAYLCALMRRAGDTFGSSEFGADSKESKVSVRLPSESGGRGE
jgi:hypothetical protein